MSGMVDENIHNKIKDLLGIIPDKYSIIEDQIPIDEQIAYFELSKKYKNNVNEEEVFDNADILFLPETSVHDKKDILTRLASIEKPKAYRIIEKYLNHSEKEIRGWAKLALLENRMSLESSLLEQNQILISTGLGGKNDKLRYFLVVFFKDKLTFNETHKKVVSNEFELIMNKFNSEIEEFFFQQTYVTITTLIPLDVPLKNMFSKAIHECNQFGNFLEDNFIITNVKKLSDAEINNFIHRNNFNDESE
jgi:hypothetical protein